MNSENRFTRRDVLRATASGVAATATAPRRREPALQRPNFLIFMTDGQRPDELSIAGNRILRTPNMDRIVREGICFQNAFVVNALCAPGRATVLTGTYSCRNGVIDNKDRLITPGIAIFSDLLHDAGYEVAFCGKSHVKGALRDHYWDYYFGYLGQASYFNCPIAEGINGRIGPDRIYKDWVDDVVTAAAVEWLASRREKPFCLFLWLYSPHAECIRPRRYLDLYDGVFIPKPGTFDDDLKGYPGKPRAFIEADNKIGTFEWCATLENLVKGHYALTAAADDNLGRALRVLEEVGKLDDTVVVHTSDHGFFLGEWRLMDKRLMHEPSIRIPLNIRYPKLIRQGAVNTAMVLNLDIAPTILQLAGVQVPEYMQGRSLLPFLEGRDPSPAWRKDWLYEFYEYPGPNIVPKNRGIRTEEFKLIEYWEQDPKEYELYDLKNDPGELHNVYNDHRYKEIREQLYRRMKELRNETGEL